MRSGYVYPGNFLSGAGYGGYYWSDRAGSSSYAYSLGFDPSYVYPSIIYYRYLGFSVRCVAGWK